MSELQSNLLTEGLQKGFGEGTNFQITERGSFKLTSSHYISEDGGIYHDEWVIGGGQELVRNTNGETLTRTYVGNVVSSERLEAVGISEKEILIFLKKIIIEYGSQTRFNTDFESIFENWKYSYKVTYKEKDPFIINGIEKIFYKGNSVFTHTFGISKVIET